MERKKLSKSGARYVPCSPSMHVVVYHDSASRSAICGCRSYTLCRVDTRRVTTLQCWDECLPKPHLETFMKNTGTYFRVYRCDNNVSRTLCFLMNSKRAPADNVLYIAQCKKMVFGNFAACFVTEPL